MWLVLFLIESYYAMQRFSTKKFLMFSMVVIVIWVTSCPAPSYLKESIRGVPLQEVVPFEKGM